jgi:hypothetical protein
MARIRGFMTVPGWTDGGGIAMRPGCIFIHPPITVAVPFRATHQVIIQVAATTALSSIQIPPATLKIIAPIRIDIKQERSVKENRVRAF